MYVPFWCCLSKCHTENCVFLILKNCHNDVHRGKKEKGDASLSNLRQGTNMAAELSRSGSEQRWCRPSSIAASR